MLVLSQFVLRLASGLALAMALTSSKKVSSGFFRNHSYVLLGLCVLATLAAWGSNGHLSWWPPMAAAVLSYACAVLMLYDRPKIGIALFALVFGVTVANAISTQTLLGASGDLAPFIGSNISQSAKLLWCSNVISSSLLMGFTIAAMFLGHWYLNAPEMDMAPLRRLLTALSAFIFMRAICNGVGLALELTGPGLTTTEWILVGLRWIAGMFGTAALVAMAWQTLKIPNTQSATGILYVAVLATFLGELTSLLLSRGTAYPL